MINYPNRPSEAEIQAVLWGVLKDAGIDARLQVTFRDGNYQKGTRLKSGKLDICCFVNEEAFCVIECKSWAIGYATQARYQKSKNSKQVRKYEALLRIPVLICGSSASIDCVKSQVLDLIEKKGYPHPPPL